MGEIEEPAILSFGRYNLDKYTSQEYRDALRRAFVDEHADFIMLDDNMHGQRFTSAAVAWGIDEGLIYHSKTESDGQCTVSAFRLTEKGIKEFK